MSIKYVETTSQSDVKTTSKYGRKRKSNRRCIIDVFYRRRNDVFYRRRNVVTLTQIESALDYRRRLNTWYIDVDERHGIDVDIRRIMDVE